MVHSANKRWPVIQDILKREGIAKQHLNSFDEFLERGLQSIINEVAQIDIENAEYPYKIQLGKVKLQQPRMMELDGSITHITPAEAILKKYNCKPTELPLIFVNDPAIMGLGVKPGDMIKITRTSPTAGESLYYRYVVEV